MARLKLLPVCERCGHVLKDGVKVEKATIEHAQGLRYSKYIITPSNCPNCNDIIECVVVNNDILSIEE